MIRIFRCLFFVILCGGMMVIHNAHGLSKENIANSCMKTFSETTQCPKELCQMGCAPLSHITDRCLQTCLPKPCFQIKAEHCPLERCQILKGCKKIIKVVKDGDKEKKVEDYEDICFNQVDEAVSCGGLAYAGQNVECCEGFVKRCGVEFFNGSCDMEGSHSVYSVPICIPCGNGICNQFENGCNCPEDCR